MGVETVVEAGYEDIDSGFLTVLMAMTLACAILRSSAMLYVGPSLQTQIVSLHAYYGSE